MQCPVRIMKWLTFRKADRMPLWVRILIMIKVWPTLHYCMEWDGLVIDKHCPEYECCSCLKDGG